MSRAVESGGAGVHWFVAWRYLLEKPRRFSRAIVSVMSACLWVIVSFGLVALWLFPLAHPILSPFQPLPWWVPIMLSLATVGTILVPIISGRVVAALGLAAVTGIFTGEAFGLVTRTSSDGARLPEARLPSSPGKPPYSLLAGIACGVFAINLLGLFWFLHRPFTDPPLEAIPTYLLVAGYAAFFLLVVVLPNAIPRYVSARAEQKRSGDGTFHIRGVFGYLVTALCVAVLLLAMGTSYWGLRHVVWPAHKTVTLGAPLFFGGAFLFIGGASSFVASFFVAPTLRHRARWIGLRVLWLGLIALCVLGFLHVRAIALQGMPSAAAPMAKLPTIVTLPILVAFALLTLSLVLHVIRYFFTFFSTVSIGGVAIGSMALVIVLSVMSGFENDLRRKILGSNAHILVTKATDRPLICRAVPDFTWHRCIVDVESAFSDYREVGARVNAVPGVVASSPYLISEVVIAANNNYANVIIKGVEPETVGDIGELDENVKFENGEIDRKALQRLWPLAEDGAVIGRPADEDASGNDSDDIDGDGFSDAIPDDPMPVDFSGDSDETEPDDEEPPDPIDLSGGDDDTPTDGIADGVDNDDADADDDDDTDDDDDADDDGGSGGRAVPLTPIPIADDIKLGPDGVYERRIPPLVAILPGTLVGKELVKQINLYNGQEVKIVSPLGQDTPLGPVPRTKRFRVAGTFFTGMYEYDLKFIYVEVGALQDFLDLGDEVTGIEIRVSDPSDTATVVARLGETLGPEYRIQDWKELNRSLFSALKLEKIAMFLVLAIIILVASFSIVGNLIMVVVEKAREIAVLKTLGTSDVGIMKIFITQGFFIGLVGTGIGVSIGLGASIAMQTFGLPLDPDVYYIDRLPIHIEPLSVALVFAAGIVISVVATLYPAYVAAGMRPVNGLRYE